MKKGKYTADLFIAHLKALELPILVVLEGAKYLQQLQTPKKQNSYILIEEEWNRIQDKKQFY